MAVQVLSLANGQLSATPKSVLYPTTAITLTTIVKSIRLVNIGTQQHTANLYFAPGGIANNARRISPPNLPIPSGVMVIDDQEITMGPTDQILGDSDVSAAIDYLISGIQR